jgi:DNA-binding CsgD family transcriptional regulator
VDERVVRIHEVFALLVAGLRDAYGLDEREQAVAKLVMFGRNSYAIAGRLGLEERTVLVQIQELFAKTNTDSRESLVRVALRLAGERERADAPIRLVSEPAPVVARPAVTNSDRSRHAGPWPAAGVQV